MPASLAPASHSVYRSTGWPDEGLCAKVLGAALKDQPGRLRLVRNTAGGQSPKLQVANTQIHVAYAFTNGDSEVRANQCE